VNNGISLFHNVEERRRCRRSEIFPPPPQFYYTVIYISMVYQGVRECWGVQREYSNKAHQTFASKVYYFLPFVVLPC